MIIILIIIKTIIINAISIRKTIIIRSRLYVPKFGSQQTNSVDIVTQITTNAPVRRLRQTSNVGTVRNKSLIKKHGQGHLHY